MANYRQLMLDFSWTLLLVYLTIFVTNTTINPLCHEVQGANRNSYIVHRKLGGFPAAAVAGASARLQFS